MVEKSSHKKMMPFPLVLAAILVATTLSTDLHSLPKTTTNKATTAPPVADCIGLRVAITDKGLKYATSIAVPLLEQELSSITIPDVPFSQDGFEGGVTAISCQQFKIGAMTLNANAAPSATLALAASGVALSCKASWTYKLKVWPHVPHGHGTVDISIGSGSAFSGTLGISNNTGVFTSLSLPACTSNVHVSNLHFSGGLSGDILNLFKSLIKKTIEKEVNGKVCGAISTALVSDLNPTLAKPPANYVACTVLGKSVVCDVSAGAPPSPSPTPPIPVPMLPVPDPTAAPTHEILIMMDMTPFNYALYIVWQAGLMDIIVTSDMIPSNFPQILNTSNFADIAPGMFKQYPNLGMQLEINVTTAPHFEIITPTTPTGNNHTALLLTLPTDILFQVLDPTTGLQNAFGVHCPFQAAVAIDVMDTASGGQVINGSLRELACTLSLVHSNVGNVSVSQLQGLVTLVTSLLEPIVNHKLKNTTVPVPSLGSINLTNSEIAFVADGQYLLVASDVVMSNKTTAVSGTHGGRLGTQEIGAAVLRLKEMSSRTSVVAWLYRWMGLFR